MLIIGDPDEGVCEPSKQCWHFYKSDFSLKNKKEFRTTKPNGN